MSARSPMKPLIRPFTLVTRHTQCSPPALTRAHYKATHPERVYSSGNCSDAPGPDWIIATRMRPEKPRFSACHKDNYGVEIIENVATTLSVHDFYYLHYMRKVKARPSTRQLWGFFRYTFPDNERTCNESAASRCVRLYCIRDGKYALAVIKWTIGIKLWIKEIQRWPGRDYH
jgi:hypothetical protein